MKKRFILIMAVLVSLSLVVGCGGGNGKTDGGGAGKAIEIKLAHDNTTSTPAHEGFLKFKEIVEEKTDGEVTVTIFPGGQMGSIQDTLEQTRQGDLEMSVGFSSGFTQTIPEFAVWDSFYLFEDAAHAHRVLDGEAGIELMKPLEKMGLEGLGYMEIGFRNFSNSVRPIEKAEDVKGLKIRGYNPMQIKAWEAVGANLTNLAWAEVFSSLQQNLIDGQESATESFYSAKFYEAQKYWSLTQHIYTNFLWYANEAFMASLSDDHKQIIYDAVEETIKYQRELAAKAEEEVLSKLPEEGIEVNEVSLEERTRMGELMNAAIKDDIIDSCGQEIYDFVMEKVEEER